MNLPTGVTVLLLIAKLVYFVDAAAFPFVVVASPIVIQAIILIIGLLSKQLIDEDYMVEFLFFSVMLTMWAVACLFISCKLDHYHDYSWYYTFIPLLMMDMWWLIGIVLAPVLSFCPCCDDCMENNSRWNHYGEAMTSCWFVMPFNVVIFLPIVVFEWLLVTNLQHDRFDTWGVIFTPIFCMFGILTVAWFVSRIAKS